METPSGNFSLPAACAAHVSECVVANEVRFETRLEVWRAQQKGRTHHRASRLFVGAASLWQ